MAKKYYICQTAKCKPKDIKHSIEETKVNTYKCPDCGKKGNWAESATAPAALGYKPELDLQLRTVDQMMQVFVIDEHQVKHYATGDSDYGRFVELEWTDVHKLICYCAKEILTRQKAAGLQAPTDGFVTFAGLAEDHWPAGKGKGRTNTVKVQMGTAGGEFSGHGYPVDDAGFNANDSPYKITVTNNAWNTTILTAANSTVRMK
jgi:hypothetical protein